MPNALRIGLLGPLQVQDEAGRVVPTGSLAEQIWPDDPPGNPGNALQTLVSRLRAELRHAGLVP
jgi:DNA-binding response OmpR family regulator